MPFTIVELAACFTAVAVLMIATNVFLPIHFETNDDACMALVSSGSGLCDVPDEHLAHMNIAVGLVLKSLTSSFPEFPWYTAWLIGVQYFSLSSIICACRQRFGPRSGSLIFLVYFFSSAIGFCSRIQFTSVATTAALAGLSLLYCWIEDDPSNPIINRKRLIWAGTLMFLSCMMRADGLILMGILGGSAFVAKGINKPRPRAAIIVLLTCILTSLAMSQVNGAYYRRTEAWNHFYDWNLQILKFYYGYIRYTPVSKPLFTSFGWSENDMDMIYLGNVGDLKMFGVDALKAITAQGASYMRVPMSPKILINDLADTLRYPMCIPPLLVTLLAIITARNRGVRLQIVGMLILSVCLMAAILAFGHLPPRVYLSILSLVSLFALFNAWDRLSQLNEGRRMAVLAILAVCNLLYVWPTLKTESEEYLKKKSELMIFLNDRNAKANQLYVAWVTLFPFEALSPFENWPGRLKQLKLVSLSQYAWTPFYNVRMREFNLANLTETADKENMFWISNPELNQKFCVYAQQHFNRRLSFQLVYEKGMFKLYKAISI